MATYTIEPGQTNFKPLENPIPRTGVRGFEFSAKFLSGSWCSLEEWEGRENLKIRWFNIPVWLPSK
jgi:hypothetical protein